MEETNCNLCGCNDTELVYVERDRLMKLPGTFHLVRCRQCGLLYLNPRPSAEELAYYYPQEYPPYTIAQQRERSWVAYVDYCYGHWKLVGAVEGTHSQGGRLLDVGCAAGDFLHVMNRTGRWEVHGVDTCPKATQYARERYGLDVFTGEVAEAGYPDGYFDVVTMWHVIEHVHDPRGTLAELHRIMKPAGLLIIGTPNLWSWDARIFGRHWLGLDAPRHLYVFSPATLQNLLQQVGFRTDKIRSFSQFYRPFARSMQFWLDERLHNERLKRALFTIIHLRIFRLLTLPYFTVMGRFNKTSGMTVWATRQDTRPDE
jgi:2-polyprenyl-3-methyl-5-hydroxy-6-metoxy-1,4-benzoquinol methylase